ncbi:MAG: alpha-glucosidase C-terminal domain-containing protein, partial [Pseudomonadota bacterium]
TGVYDPLFRKLIALKTEMPALWNGRYGAPMVEVPNNASENVFSFVRGEKGERVFAVFSLSGEAQQVEFSLARHTGNYVDALSGGAATFGEEEGEAYGVSLQPWGYRIFREVK